MYLILTFTFYREDDLSLPSGCEIFDVSYLVTQISRADHQEQLRSSIESKIETIRTRVEGDDGLECTINFLIEQIKDNANGDLLYMDTNFTHLLWEIENDRIDNAFPY